MQGAVRISPAGTDPNEGDTAKKETSKHNKIENDTVEKGDATDRQGYSENMGSTKPLRKKQGRYFPLFGSSAEFTVMQWRAKKVSAKP